MRILIAEDDPTSRVLLQRALTRWGHEVIATSDGAEALEQLREEGSPRLAILDWMMPGVDGLEICRRLRGSKATAGAYVILLTARSSRRDVIEGLDAGADDFVSKPFDANELRARVAVGCRVIELQSALAERVSELQEAMDHIKQLQGILPICMHCRKIRTDDDAWHELEVYIQENSEAEFSHGVCPDCLALHYPDHDK